MFALARTEANVLEVRTTPVVFLPGIMGSRLRLRDGDDDDDDATVDWDPDSEWMMFNRWIRAEPAVRARRLVASNPATVLASGNGLSASRCARGWAGVVAEYYLDILEELESELQGASFKCPVYAFGYDWRQKNTASGAKLKVFVEEVLTQESASTVLLVTHSMGGLVARSAMTDLQFRNDKIAGAVHIGQPTLGAPSAYRRMLVGAIEDLDGMAVAGLVGNKDSAAQIFQGIPSVFELFPSDARSSPSESAHSQWMFFRDADKPDERRTFPQSNTFKIYMMDQSPPGVASSDDSNRQQIRRAVGSGVRASNKLGVTMHPLTAVIYGDDVETDTSAVFTLTEEGIEGASYDVLDGRSEAGDGTVPRWSAEALFPGQAHEADEAIDPETQSQWVVRGVQHDEMCKSSVVQKATIQFIEALLHPPRLARTRIGSDGAVAWRTIKAALGGDRSAEMEIRVAKLLVQEGESVTLAENPSTHKTPDLHTSRGDADVKFSKGGTETRLRGLVRSGLGQIGDNGRVLMVRATNSDIASQEYLRVLEEEFVRAFGADYRSTVTARYRLIREAELPPLWDSPPRD